MSKLHKQDRLDTLHEAVQRVRALCDDNDRPNALDVHVPGFVRVDDLRTALADVTDDADTRRRG